MPTAAFGVAGTMGAKYQQQTLFDLDVQTSNSKRKCVPSTIQCRVDSPRAPLDYGPHWMFSARLLLQSAAKDPSTMLNMEICLVFRLGGQITESSQLCPRIGGLLLG